MTLVLRDATSSDAAAVASIYVGSWNAGFAGHLPARVLTDREVGRWEGELTDGAVRWRVAVEAGEVVGFAGTGPSREPVDPTLGELDTIAVSTGVWRRGIGSALMSDALGALRTAGFVSAVLWTLENYPQADAFYRRLGWRPDGGTRDSGRQVSYRHALDLVSTSTHR